MGGGIKRNKISLPRGKTCDGSDQQPGDEQQGEWTRQQRERMDEAFCRALGSALRNTDSDKRS